MSDQGWACPLPHDDGGVIKIGHGGGGRLTRDLLRDLIVPTLDNGALEAEHDSAILNLLGERIAFTTDSFVVTPRFFPGGDIGSLAVYGTVNDLAMAGAQPKALSVALIVEEGMAADELKRVAESMRAAADEAGVQVSTGDTKVVNRGAGDGVYINTSGVGVVSDGLRVHPDQIRVGDRILLSGDLGRHGIAILAQREGLALGDAVSSDCALLAPTALALTELAAPVHCMRDCTRGGLASALVEIAGTRAVGMHVKETCMPVSSGVRGACELLGLDPTYVACEGRFVAFVDPSVEDAALAVLREGPGGEAAVCIGEVTERGGVILETALGVDRVLEMLSGEQLPRIC